MSVHSKPASTAFLQSKQDVSPGYCLRGLGRSQSLQAVHWLIQTEWLQESATDWLLRDLSVHRSDSLLSWHVYQHSTTLHKVQTADIKFCLLQCSQSTILSALGLLAGRENIAAAQEQLPPAGLHSHIDVICFPDDVSQSQDSVLQLPLESNKVQITLCLLMGYQQCQGCLECNLW